MKKNTKQNEFPLLPVTQWVPEWENVRFTAGNARSRPDRKFYVGSIPAGILKALTGVYRRSVKQVVPRAEDQNIQRGHEESRSKVIREFIEYGYPWCEMNEDDRTSDKAGAWRKPGWLPTPIVVNLLTPKTRRNGLAIGQEDLAKIETNGHLASLFLPGSFSGPSWRPKTIFPLEVIDGQHRLWAFEDFDPGDDYQLPVVVFNGLDVSWQAYLFYSINISPKKINRSLAFDLYPLLRGEDWVDHFQGHRVYRETRCQELVESLWLAPESPWHRRINMLGETRLQTGELLPMVTQAAWIRSLMATFVKEWDARGNRIGGMFGAPRGSDQLALKWGKSMQSAFLIYAGQSFRNSVRASKEHWAVALREIAHKSPRAADKPLFDSDKLDAAFYGDHSLIPTDQGIRGFLAIFNDVVCYELRYGKDRNGLEWRSSDAGSLPRTGNRCTDGNEEADDPQLAGCLKSLHTHKLGKLLTLISEALASFDWRSSSAPDLEDKDRNLKAAFRGGGGYRLLRAELLKHLAQDINLGASAEAILKTTGD